jgi:hypothetical protein
MNRRSLFRLLAATPLAALLPSVTSPPKARVQSTSTAAVKIWGAAIAGGADSPPCEVFIEGKRYYIPIYSGHLPSAH